MASALGDLIKQRRGDMTLRELSRDADVGLGYLSRIERGEALSPSPRVLGRVARVLGPDDGLYGDLMRAAGYL